MNVRKKIYDEMLQENLYKECVEMQKLIVDKACDNINPSYSQSRCANAFGFFGKKLFDCDVIEQCQKQLIDSAKIAKVICSDPKIGEQYCEKAITELEQRFKQCTR